MAEDTSRISITAHYTGYVWYKNGLSTEPFVTPEGRAAYHALLPGDRMVRKFLGTDLETLLLQRHVIIDHLIEKAFFGYGELQVLELACGLSPRGYRFKRKFPGKSFKYVEADLPGMARRKEKLLSELDALGSEHRVVPCNILETEGPLSLEQLLQREFDQSKPIIVITEGLVNYFPTAVIEPFWQRLAKALRGFKSGCYFTDMVSDDAMQNNRLWLKLGMKMLTIVARGKTALHYSGDTGVKQGMKKNGFDAVRIHNPKEYYGKLPIPVSKAEPNIRVVESCVIKEN